MKVQWASRESIKCSKCDEVKNISRFGFRKGSGYYSFCKDCRNREYREKVKDKPMHWAYRAGKINTRAKSKGIPYGLTGDILESLWTAQGGRCIYTGEEMVIEHGNRNNPLTLSVDRVDPEKGYIEGNIVLCTLRANTIKSNLTEQEFKEWMPKWHQKIERLYNEN